MTTITTDPRELLAQYTAEIEALDREYAALLDGQKAQREAAKAGGRTLIERAASFVDTLRGLTKQRDNAATLAQDMEAVVTGTRDAILQRYLNEQVDQLARRARNLADEIIRQRSIPSEPIEPARRLAQAGVSNAILDAARNEGRKAAERIIGEYNPAALQGQD